MAKAATRFRALRPLFGVEGKILDEQLMSLMFSSVSSMFLEMSTSGKEIKR